MAKLVGYARVSTEDQDVALQRDALHEAGCREELIFVDKVSGARTQRPGLDACLGALEPGDTLVVWRLDRLGRSMPHLVTLIQELLAKGVAFRSLCDGAIDTTSASGELIFHIFSALAQFERRLIQERTKAGLSAARARGRKGGRKPTTGRRSAGEDRAADVQRPRTERETDLQDAGDLAGDVLPLSGGGQRANTGSLIAGNRPNALGDMT